jgi:hypothetical protein
VDAAANLAVAYNSTFTIRWCGRRGGTLVSALLLPAIAEKARWSATRLCAVWTAGI